MKTEFIAQRGLYDIFKQNNHYYVQAPDGTIVYMARTFGRCERWIDKQYENDRYHI